MIQAFEFIATLCAGLFAGAALYINIAEHPARMGLETRIAALQWAPSYKRATWLQAPLALLSFLSGVVAWLLGAGAGWLVAAVLIGVVVPFTLIGIMPNGAREFSAVYQSRSVEPFDVTASAIVLVMGDSMSVNFGVTPRVWRSGVFM